MLLGDVPNLQLWDTTPLPELQTHMHQHLLRTNQSSFLDGSIGHQSGASNAKSFVGCHEWEPSPRRNAQNSRSSNGVEVEASPLEDDWE